MNIILIFGIEKGKIMLNKIGEIFDHGLRLCFYISVYGLFIWAILGIACGIKECIEWILS